MGGALSSFRDKAGNDARLRYGIKEGGYCAFTHAGIYSANLSMIEDVSVRWALKYDVFPDSSYDTSRCS
jgi:hypothetical protein